MNEKPKTFAELGLSFSKDMKCETCDGNKCHNRVTNKNGVEYDLHIYSDDMVTFYIEGYPDAYTESDDDIYKPDLNEEEAVSYLCSNFNNFKCF